MNTVSAPDVSLSHRLGSSEVTVRGADGQLLADHEVTVEQTGHAFGFGNIGFDLVPHANGESVEEGLAEAWLALFNHATLPFYWARFEPVRGEPDTARLLRTAEWFVERGVRVKGHPLVWHTLAPTWLLDPDGPLSAVEAAIRSRIARDVTDFAGVIDLWDAINEVVIMPVFEKEDNAVTRLAQQLGRVGMVRLAFEAAREANPAARLVLNDFDLSADYEALISQCLDAGITIDALGLQTHMHQGFRGEEELLAVTERFSRFGLPLQFTETTLVSGDLMPPHIVDLNDFQVPSWPSTPEGEERQRDEVVRHYRTLVGQPLVESITYWGITDRGAWLGAPAGLVRADGTPKPAYAGLHDLIRGQWWVAPTTVRTDADGRFAVRGFAGDYQVSAGAAVAALTLSKGSSAVDVTLA